MKKVMVVLLVLAVAIIGIVGLTACNKSNEFKVGVILIGDETEGYSEAHINGINAAAEKLGLSKDQIVWKKSIVEDDGCYNTAKELVAVGCNLVISNSYGHQDYMVKVAEEYPDVTFIAMTGDQAAVSGLSNFKNAFTKVYQSRFISGVVAGMKLKELNETNKIEANSKDSAGNIKVGYVGAHPFAEVISGYTAFYLGIKHVMPNVVMDVQFTGSWYDWDAEKEVAEALMSKGCVIIGQHADSTGAPTAVAAEYNKGKQVYSVGYNVDMLGVSDSAILTSASNNWVAYYEYAIGAAMKGEEIVTNWSEGYETNAVQITALGKKVAEGTEAKVNEAIAKIKDGTLKVFDCAKFTVDGVAVTSHKANTTCLDFSKNPPAVIYQGKEYEVIKTEKGITFFDESSVDVRSAPYFDLAIDGITKLTK